MNIEELYGKVIADDGLKVEFAEAVRVLNVTL